MKVNGRKTRRFFGSLLRYAVGQNRTYEYLSEDAKHAVA